MEGHAKQGKDRSRLRLGTGPSGLVPPPEVEFSSGGFHGTLGTLLEQVRSHKIELRDVELLPLCETYFRYLIESGLHNLDEAAAALVGLSYLLERKAWALLPVEEPEPEEDLQGHLKFAPTEDYGEAIEALRLWHEERATHFFRTGEKQIELGDTQSWLEDVEPSDLARAFERVLQKAVSPTLDRVHSPRRSLAEQMDLVLAAMSEEPRVLETLIPQPFTRSDAVYWFLALLELIRLGKIGVTVRGDDVLFGLVKRRATKV